MVKDEVIKIIDEQLGEFDRDRKLLKPINEKLEAEYRVVREEIVDDKISDEVLNRFLINWKEKTK